MRVVFIYGPSGTGKLTVAKELSKITNYKLFHNHLAFDFIDSIVDFKKPYFFDLVHKTMLEGITLAAKENIQGLVFTFVYFHPEDKKFVQKFIQIVKKNNGKVHFVKLYCSESELFKRIKSDSRKSTGKLKTNKELRKQLMNNVYAKVPFGNSLAIDNTKIAPKLVAKKIKSFYNL